MIITVCGQHDSVNESAQAISLRQQLCVNVSPQTELKDGLAAYYICCSGFLIHRRMRLFLIVVVVLGGNWGDLLLILFPAWPIHLYKYNDCRNQRQKKGQSLRLWVLSSVMVSFEKFCLMPGRFGLPMPAAS